HHIRIDISNEPPLVVGANVLRIFGNNLRCRHAVVVLKFYRLIVVSSVEALVIAGRRCLSPSKAPSPAQLDHEIALSSETLPPWAIRATSPAMTRSCGRGPPA